MFEDMEEGCGCLVFLLILLVVGYVAKIVVLWLLSLGVIGVIILGYIVLKLLR